MANILIVDDEDDIRYVLSLLLKNEGYGVFEAADGKTAYEILKTNAIDLVMLDIILPDIDGITVLSEIRKNYRTPVIMISGYGDIDKAVESIKLGAVDYVSKPFDNEKLLYLIAKTVEKEGMVKDKGLLRRKLIQVLLGNKEEKKEEFELPKKINYPKIILISVILIIFLYFGIKIGNNFLTKSFRLIYTHPTGITYFDGNYYISDWYTRNIYVHKIFPDFKIRQVFPLKDEVPFGLTVEHRYLWACDNWAKKVYRYRIDTMQKITEYELPGISPSGIAFDGKFLWISDLGLKTITKHKIDDSLTVEKTFVLDKISPISVFWFGGTIWTADKETGLINRHRLDGTLSVEKTYLPIHFVSGEKKLLSAGTDGKNIFTLTLDKDMGLLVKETVKTLILTNE